MSKSLFNRALSILVIFSAALALGDDGPGAGDWPCWRGGRLDGVSDDKEVPVQWDAGHNVRWKTAIPGVGHSSPIVCGQRVYLTSAIESTTERVLMALDRRDGKIIWKKTVLTAPLEGKNKLNSFASSTPATDGKYIWVTFLQGADVQVVCYDVDGNEVWRRSPGHFHSKHGYCSSLIPWKQTIILNADQDAVAPDRAFVVALDKLTGQERWRIDRPGIRSYTPPFIVNAAGKDQMVFSGSKCVASYDPDTGRQHWIVDGPTEQFVATMVYTDGMFMITGGFPTLHILGIRPDGQGNVTQSHVAWHVTKGVSYVPSPIASGKYFFVVSDDGKASCLEAATGKYMWTQKLGKHHSSSLVLANGLIYFLDDAGETFVIKASENFEQVSKNDLGEECRASPAISRGEMFIRGVENLYCIGRK